MLRNFHAIAKGFGAGMFVLALDGKHRLFKGDFKLVTVFAIYRSQLGKCDKTKMEFHTAHAAAIMQAFCPEESEDATVFLFKTLAAVAHGGVQDRSDRQRVGSLYG